MNDRLRAGAAKELIDLKRLLPYQGFSNICDDLFVRSLYLQGKINQLFVNIDVTSLKDSDIEEIKGIIHERFDISREEIWVMVSHNFNSIHTRSEEALVSADAETIAKDREFREILREAILQSVGKAEADMEDVSFGFKYSSCDINVNRNNVGYVDKELGLIKVINERGSLKAVIYNYSMQSSYMEDYEDSKGNKVISSDIIGYVSSRIEDLNKGSVALFMLGSGGDLRPKTRLKKEEFHQVNAPSLSQCYSKMAEIGEILLNKITTAMNSIDCHCREGEATRKNSLMRLSLKDVNNLKELPLSMLHIGPVTMVGVQPELTAILGKEIKQQSKALFTMIGTMVNGGCKYLPHREAYEIGTYEVGRSIFRKGSGEDAVVDIVKKINEMRN